jgi:fatty-acyl-CoA synthase
MGTVAELVWARRGNHAPAVRFEDQAYSHDEVARAAARRAAALAGLRRAGPFHVGVLLDNTPEFLWWLEGAALAGATVVGINPTRRGPDLARDIRHTECQLLVTEQRALPILAGLDLGIAPDRTLVVDGPGYDEQLSRHGDPAGEPAQPAAGVDPATALLLTFTSGSTGAPKAVICSQGRLHHAAAHLVERFPIDAGSVCYVPMPMFHGNALMADWAPALYAGASLALRRRFSASGFLPDVSAYGVTYFTYVGRAISYILATPERPDDADNTLVLGFGTEAGIVDRDRFERRFGCRLVEGYGSSEGGAHISASPGTPPAAVGLGDEHLAVVDPKTGEECPRAVFDAHGRLLNGTAAIGELVNRGPSLFEGYWRNEEAAAARRRDGAYWTGDLFYRDADGYFYFAGRSADWLRVDSENLAVATIEAILARHEPVHTVAVYGVPDPVTGDAVMCALQLREGGEFDAAGFGKFLAGQADLGTKMAPRFVRVVPRMPVTGTNKVMKTGLRRERWDCADPVWWRPSPALVYEPFTDGDAAALQAEFTAHGRSGLLER